MSAEVTEGLEFPTRFGRGKPGAKPGIAIADLETMPAAAARVPIECIDYAPGQVERRRITDLDAFVESRRPAWVRVRWVNVDGLEDPQAIRALAIKYGLHPLAIEDILSPQRPKIETFPAQEGRPPHLFLVVRMIQHEQGVLQSEQISMFIEGETVVTFQESPGDIWEPIRRRLEKAGSRIRELDASYLAYALIDAIVDHCFPVLEHYGDRLEELEDLILDRPDRGTISEIHRVKRELLLLRRAIWPMREVVNTMHREPHECMTDTTRTYLRDVYDHLVQIMDIVETYREMATSLTETYMTSMSNRLSEVMKVLTVIGTIFIPLTFLAGVYGMNMEIPENHWHLSYPLFWAVCLGVAGGMFYWFRRRGWM